MRLSNIPDTIFVVINFKIQHNNNDDNKNEIKRPGVS